jgi:hypothetical protein
MSVLSTGRCVASVVLVTVLAFGIAIGILFPGIWPFTKAAPTAAPTAAAQSASKIVEEWGQELPSHPGSIERYTLTVGPENASGRMTIGQPKDGPPAATAFLIFRTGKKFEDVWKHYAKKCGQDGAKESLPRNVAGTPEAIRGGIQHGKGSDEFMAVDFGGLAPAKFGGEPGVRESHFGYFTEGFVVHVVIEEVAPDRNVNDKDSVKVRVFAAVR